MAMYECSECGEEYGNFPKVFLAVNGNIPDFPNHHESEFEKNFNELYQKIKDVGVYSSDNWRNFWSWLGDRKIKWFCCIECAQKFLEKNQNGTPNNYLPEYDEVGDGNL